MRFAVRQEPSTKFNHCFSRELRERVYHSAALILPMVVAAESKFWGRREMASGLKHMMRIWGFGLTAMLLGNAGFVLRAQTLDDNALKGLKWRQVGPFRGGRALAGTGIAGDPETYYFGSVAGGVWKTTNGGLTWTPMTDKTGIMSVGAIAVAPSDPNTVYVGTGESCWRGNISYGDGMYKSVDGGKTWTHIRSEEHTSELQSRSDLVCRL